MVSVEERFLFPVAICLSLDLYYRRGHLEKIRCVKLCWRHTFSKDGSTYVSKLFANSTDDREQTESTAANATANTNLYHVPSKQIQIVARLLLSTWFC